MTFPIRPTIDRATWERDCFTYLWLLFNGAESKLVKAAADQVLLNSMISLRGAGHEPRTVH
jgi:hypothetical protein